MAEAKQQRKVPGASPTQVKQGPSKRTKGPQQTSQPQVVLNGKRNDAREALERAVHDATLAERAPNHYAVDESVKVQVQDLAEEAERNSAIAAVAIIEEKDSNGRIADKDNKSPLRVILSKRLKVLSKKLQKAVTYEALEEDRLNADMKRIIASKPGLEGAVAELTEVMKAIEINEGEVDKEMKKQSKLAMEATRRDIKVEEEKRNAALFQFLYLRSLFQPPSIPTFAPPPMPEVVNKATAQDVAAIEKLFADLSSSTEVMPQSQKESIIEKLVSRSKDDVMEGVAYLRIAELIEGLSSPVVLQPKEPSVEVEAPSSGHILFMQDSEIAAAKSNAGAGQAEPEGGPVEGLPESKESHQSNGTIMGDTLPEEDENQNGTAQAQVAEPIQTTEVGQKPEDLIHEEVATNKPSPAIAAPALKKIDWAADDDDWSDMVMQPSGNASSTAQSAVLTPAATVEDSTSSKANGIVNLESSTAPRKVEVPVSKPIQQPRPENASEKNVKALKSSGPEVDEDGFIIASSKRSKHLQQQQQQYHQQQHQNEQSAFRNGGRRGGREGSSRGGNARGGSKGFGGRPNGTGMGSGRGGNVGADSRGRGRGRGVARAEASST